MPIFVLIAGGAAALAGAVVWALISWGTGYEVGYVAWGIGALVGFAGSVAGGRGKPTGVACAVLAVVSIFAGKVLAVKLSAPGAIEKEISPMLTQDKYDEAMADAEAFAGLSSEDQHAQFMVERGYSEAGDAALVPAGDLAGFRKDTAPHLRNLHEDKPAYEAWKRERVGLVTDALLANVSLSELVVEDLNVIDFVFAILGILTAFRIGAAGLGPKPVAGPPTAGAAA